ncbi:MAG: molybdopterin-dependent oxidoreductase [Methanoregula sp.]|nr:molybdopterin-dependent oxidoreductase [Methanoregula sp.]
MNTRTLFAAVVIVIAVAAVVIIMSMTGGAGPLRGAPTPLSSVEVRSYQGEDLSPITAFHENSIKGPQYINESAYRLTVTGLTNRTNVYTYREVLDQYPHFSKVVTLFCVEGWDATILWEGVLVRDLITTADPDPRADTVVFTAHDGYTTSFPLAYLMDRDIIMASTMNNVTLPAERGFPFALVAEDRWGYKWIKWIEKIELTDDPAYRGYWEQRGYSNDGDLNRSYYS